MDALSAVVGDAQKGFYPGCAWQSLPAVCPPSSRVAAGWVNVTAAACSASVHQNFALWHTVSNQLLSLKLKLLCCCCDVLQDETVVLYSSREERQHWHVPSITSTAAPANSSSSKRTTSAGSNGVSDGLSAEEDTEDSGGSFWLPGGAVVTLRMVASKAGAGSGSADGSGSEHRGLLIGLHMLDGSGSCLLIEREYDADGRLLEVRQGTAVKGGWSGGRM